MEALGLLILVGFGIKILHDWSKPKWQKQLESDQEDGTYELNVANGKLFHAWVEDKGYRKGLLSTDFEMEEYYEDLRNGWTPSKPSTKTYDISKEK